jgi:hypothetical protein
MAPHWPLLDWRWRRLRAEQRPGCAFTFAAALHPAQAAQSKGAWPRTGNGEVEQRGIEPRPPYAPSVVNRRVNDADQTTQDDQRRRDVSASGDAVEAALARAIEAEVDERATGWEARVALLAGELRARRLARSGIAFLVAKARKPA